jgi:hypothetical protein
VIARGPHLHDDRLFDCYLAERGGEPIDPPAAEHLADCSACGARYAELVSVMETVRTSGEAEADAVFTPERLRAQQQQIARRIEHIGRPARVISFPRQFTRGRMTASATRTAPRWVAAAAAAGLFVGLALGASYRWDSELGPNRPLGGEMVATRPARLMPAAARSINPSNEPADDAFLMDLEVALERPHTPELVAFDALTPHVREISDSR